MTNQREITIKYVPCYFEFKVPFQTNWIDQKRWFYPIIWILVGMVCLALFAVGLHYFDSSIDWFTTLYFVGGLGWVPSAMCGLSRSYYRIFQKICPYLDESETALEEYYKKTAKSIFGYLKDSKNFSISLVIWFLMLVTVLVNNNTFSAEYTSTLKFIYICYIPVAVVFACVPCAVLHFFRVLLKLRKFKLKKDALYQGAGEQIQKVHANCTRLIWGIIFLFALLSLAMFKSPYHEALWVWLPAFGFVPFGFFIMNKLLTDSLINTALSCEECILQKQINSILHAQKTEQTHLSMCF